MIRTYYNEIDPFAAQWLRNLGSDNQITPGEVDERSIKDVRGSDLSGVRRAHFFAGIGGWDYALRLAGWPEREEVWTGSCPCQPYSRAGRQKKFEDARDLWPDFFRLIAECRPSTVFGEQVIDGPGALWFSRVRSDLEAEGYAVGAADLCAAGVGAPTISQRVFWVASTNCDGSPKIPFDHIEVSCFSQEERESKLGTALSWRSCEVSLGSDGKWRRLESGIEPLVDGFPGRVEQIRAYGNAIVPQVAAEFIMAFMGIANFPSSPPSQVSGATDKKAGG